MSPPALAEARPEVAAAPDGASAYGRFVSGGEPEWARVERALATAAKHGPSALTLHELDALAAAHRRVVADFAWARTAFPGTPAERRLRRLAFEGHRVLAAEDPPLRERVATYFGETFPRAFAEARQERAVALAGFGAGVLLGLVLATFDEAAAGWFLGEEQMAGLRRGEMWTDHLTSVAPGGALSGFIARNNMSVALFAWIGGAAGGLGSLYALALNGVMLGAVFAVCARYGTLDRLLAFVPAHGVLELYVITVAAAAGLKLARGLVVAGPRPRAVTAAEAGRSSLALAAGTLPWLLLLGFVEGYVSPLDLPLAVEAGIGVLLLGVFLAATRVRPG
ncbi:MAG: stage II sporulation protein M [Myxococcota bacterium]